MCALSARLARSARWTSSATTSTGRSRAAHSTRRSTASKIRSRSSSGAAIGAVAPRCRSAAARSGASRPSSAGQAASCGGAGTAATSSRASSCQTARGASPPTSTPAPTATRAPVPLDPLRHLADQAGLADAGLAGDERRPGRRRPAPAPRTHELRQLRRAPEHGQRARAGACPRRWCDGGPRSSATTARTAGPGRAPAHRAGARRGSGPRPDRPPGRRQPRADGSAPRARARRGGPERSAAVTIGRRPRRRRRPRRTRRAVPAVPPAGTVVGPRLAGPVLVDVGQRVAAADRDRGGEVATLGEPGDLAEVDPHPLRRQAQGRSGRFEGIVADGPAQRPHRGTQAGAAPRLVGVRPEPRGQSLRGCGPGAPRGRREAGRRRAAAARKRRPVPPRRCPPAARAASVDHSPGSPASPGRRGSCSGPRSLTLA